MRIKSYLAVAVIAGLPIGTLIGIRVSVGQPIWPQVLMLALMGIGMVIGVLVEKGHLGRAVYWPIGGAMVFGGGIGLVATVVASLV